MTIKMKLSGQTSFFINILFNVNIILGEFNGGTVNYPKYPVFFEEQNVGFSTQIHKVTLTNNWIKKRDDIM